MSVENRDIDLAEQQEELLAQKEELTAAIEELVRKNNYLSETLTQLQKRNQELDLLLYRTSHDLKTPITSIQGLVNLMLTEDLSESQHQLLEFMDQKASQMNDILKSLNMLSQASFEKITLKKIVLADIVRMVIRDLRYLPNFKHVSLHFDYHQLTHINSDELAIYNILKCLISNAIIFRESSEGGDVWISFEQQQDQTLIIEVTDDGDGIPPEIGSKIFDMFYRGSERSHGSGLGLYIVKTVVERLSGEMRWISRPGKTTFQIVLPNRA